MTYVGQSVPMSAKMCLLRMELCNVCATGNGMADLYDMWATRTTSYDEVALLGCRKMFGKVHPA